MKKSITIKGNNNKEADKLSNSVRNYIEEKSLDHIKKFLDPVQEPVFFDVTVDMNWPHPHQMVDLRIHGPHFEIIVKKEGVELYKMIDMVFDEAEEQLIRRKEKRIDFRKHGDRFKGS